MGIGVYLKTKHITTNDKFDGVIFLILVYSKVNCKII